MRLDSVYRVTPKLQRADPQEVDALARWLAAPLPTGYREHVATLGRGTYHGLWMVRMPQDVRAGCADRQAFLREHFDDLWGEDPSLPRDEAMSAVSFAHSVDGDEAFYSRSRHRLFVLPRHSGRVHWVPQDVDDPLDWLPRADWNADGAADPFRYFDSGQARQIVELFTAVSLEMETTVRDIDRHFRPAHRLDGPGGTLLFLPAIHGSVQLTQAAGDGRIRIRLAHDTDCATAVAPLLADWAAQGFRETWRHPPHAG